MVSEEYSGLSPVQTEVMRYIASFFASAGMPPTRADIAAERKCNRATAEQHLRALARKGWIELLPGTTRGVRILRKSAQEDLLPVIGRVAAGPAVLHTDEVDDYYRIDPRLFSPAARYLRRVIGDSMIDMGIQSGDLVGVHPIPIADNNQIVIAKLFRSSGGPEITVKKYRRRGNRVELIARNAAVPTIVVDLTTEQLEIEGIYCGHIHPGHQLRR